LPIRYSSSLRARPVEETLIHARRVGREVGVVRVTDTTRLDRLGVPVYAAIRPDARQGSLCVSAGKGLRREEAEIGAYMEAIELAHAEPPRARLDIVPTTARAVLDAHERGAEALVDLCPYVGARLDLDTPMDCVVAEDFFTGERSLLPVEVVLVPVRRTLFGSDTNGLSSGNTILEATVHGLCEVVERDIESFLLLKDTTVKIRNETLPPPLRELAERAEREGVELYLRYQASHFRIPFFLALIRERNVREGIHTGAGCHPWSEIAATRAITEAFQSRLTVIHGGRDDLAVHLEKTTRFFEQDGERFHRLIDGYSSAASMSFAECDDRSGEAATLEQNLALLAAEVRLAGLRRFFRVVLSRPESPLAVVRVIVPGLEFSKLDNDRRMGRRLLQKRRELARPPD
jgi:ribosomal protein S12 methylthiotransferase accessory factor